MDLSCTVFSARILRFFSHSADIFFAIFLANYPTRFSTALKPQDECSPPRIRRNGIKYSRNQLYGCFYLRSDSFLIFLSLSLAFLFLSFFLSSSFPSCSNAYETYFYHASFSHRVLGKHTYTLRTNLLRDMN